MQSSDRVELPVVALVGRPNVGKSTLFNALTRSRDAIVADYEGLTRDRRYGTAEYEEQRFVVVDTGGLTGRDDGVEGMMEQQVAAAIGESDLLLFLVDARAGLMAEDERIAQVLRATGKTVVIIANKVDGLDEDVAASDFYSLGFEQVLPIAASHRRGINSVYELVLELMPAVNTESVEDVDGGIRLAVLGRPNVGKSTLINRLLGEDRVVAFDLPGTTRDTVEIPWEYEGHDFVLMDTAGVRRRSKVALAIEKFSIIKALQAIQRSHLVIVMVDASEGIVEQDATLLGHVLEAGRPLVIAINKWDGLAAEERKSVKSELDRRLSFVPYAEQVFISAKHGGGMRELMDAVLSAHASLQQEFSTSRLTDIVRTAAEEHSPPSVGGRAAKLRYAHLGTRDPLTFIIHGTRVTRLPESYKRYLTNTLRRVLNLVGTPLHLRFRQGDNPFKDKKNPLTERQLAKKRRLKKYIKKNKR